MSFSILVTYFVISLDSTIRLSSFTTSGPTHTTKFESTGASKACEEGMRTLFPDERVITVVRIVGVSQTPVRVLELEELVSVLARVTSAIEEGGERVSLCVIARRKEGGIGEGLCSKTMGQYSFYSSLPASTAGSRASHHDMSALAQEGELQLTSTCTSRQQRNAQNKQVTHRK